MWSYLIGWMVGWLVLFRPRRLPLGHTSTPHPPRPAVAIVVPARNEGHAIPHLLEALSPQVRTELGDELVLVDDASTDDTAAQARHFGATVVAAPPVPAGWLGKPNACLAGARATSAPLLLFIDADVVPSADLLDRLAVEMNARPGAITSVQPWHATQRWYEQASLLFNLTSLMGTSLSHKPMAFGPILCVKRSVYDRVGGHGNPDVRGRHTEDIALARAVGTSTCFVGDRSTRFRMHPGGVREMVNGWTRSIGTGFSSTPWWLAVATIAWVWSIAAGWITWPWAYPLTAVQLFILGKRAGRFHPLTALLYPVVTLFFAAVTVRSLVLYLARRQVTWKGRSVPSRSRPAE